MILVKEKEFKHVIPLLSFELSPVACDTRYFDLFSKNSLRVKVMWSSSNDAELQIEKTQKLSWKNFTIKTIFDKGFWKPETEISSKFCV